MSDNKLSDVIRNASAVNLRYSASLVSLARDYVKAFSEALTQGVADAPAGNPQAAGPPLLLAGREGETANAAFSISGGARLPETLTLAVHGDFADTAVWVEPRTVSLRDGKAAIIRIMATIGDQTPIDKDFAGEVAIEELSRKVTDFVVRKLPDA